jgi:hypothetical protein
MHKRPIDPLALPYGYMPPSDVFSNPIDVSSNHDLGIKLAYPLTVYFPSAADRKRFAKALKKAIDERGEWSSDHLKDY